MNKDEQQRPSMVGPRQVVYQNAYQQIYSVRLDFADHQKEIFVTDYGQRVGVIIDGPEGILLIRQYRHLIDNVSWEIPGGRVDQGEGLEEAARRECMEETGILCRGLKPLIMFHPGLDTLHNPTHLFYARDVDRKGEIQEVHNGEVCGRDWVPLEKCISMISSKVIVDSLSVIALLSYHLFMRQK
jgi:8-oxo-dGTP pyrophosphatase MutT (NUDIX family)